MPGACLFLILACLNMPGFANGMGDGKAVEAQLVAPTTSDAGSQFPLSWQKILDLLKDGVAAYKGDPLKYFQFCLDLDNIINNEPSTSDQLREVLHQLRVVSSQLELIFVQIQWDGLFQQAYRSQEFIVLSFRDASDLAREKNTTAKAAGLARLRSRILGSQGGYSMKDHLRIIHDVLTSLSPFDPEGKPLLLLWVERILSQAYYEAVSQKKYKTLTATYTNATSYLTGAFQVQLMGLGLYRAAARGTAERPLVLREISTNMVHQKDVLFHALPNILAFDSGVKVGGTTDGYFIRYQYKNPWWPWGQPYTCFFIINNIPVDSSPKLGPGCDPCYDGVEHLLYSQAEGDTSHPTAPMDSFHFMPTVYDDGTYWLRSSYTQGCVSDGNEECPLACDCSEDSAKFGLAFDITSPGTITKFYAGSVAELSGDWLLTLEAA